MSSRFGEPLRMSLITSRRSAALVVSWAYDGLVVKNNRSKTTRFACVWDFMAVISLKCEWVCASLAYFCLCTMVMVIGPCRCCAVCPARGDSACLLYLLFGHQSGTECLAHGGLVRLVWAWMVPVGTVFRNNGHMYLCRKVVPAPLREECGDNPGKFGHSKETHQWTQIMYIMNIET